LGKILKNVLNLEIEEKDNKSYVETFIRAKMNLGIDEGTIFLDELKGMAGVTMLTEISGKQVRN